MSLPHLVARVLAHLESAEQREINPHFQDDLRIAWITVSKAARGDPAPHVSASYAVLGLHPDRVWPAIIERRKAISGSLYEEFFGVNLPPKKPAAREEHRQIKTARAVTRAA